MGEFHWIREPPVRHHLPQTRHPRCREDKPRSLGRLIKAHQVAINQALGCRRQLWLILLRAASPRPQRKPSSDRRKKAEELIELAANVLALASVNTATGALSEVVMGASVAHRGPCVWC
jgi:hypothetical protein